MAHLKAGRKPTSYIPWFCLIYFMFYFAQYPMYTYIPTYLKSLSFSNFQIGILTAVGPVITIIAQNVWGMAADRAKTKNRILFIVILGTALATMFFHASPIHKYFVVMFFILASVYFFLFAIQSITETITIEYTAAHQINYAFIRACGSLGYAVCGILLSIFPNFSSAQIFLLLTISNILILLPAWRMPRTKGYQGGNTPGKKVNITALFRYKELMLFLAFALCVYLCNNFGIAFGPVYLIDEIGISRTTFNLFTGLSVFFQAVVLMFAGKLFAKMNLYTLFLIAGATEFLRYCVISFLAVNAATVFVALNFLLHALSTILFLYGGVLFVNKSVPAELKATGQSLWLMVTLGISPAIGNILGGAISEAIGSLAQTFLVYTIFLGLAVLLFTFLFRGKKAYLNE